MAEIISMRIEGLEELVKRMRGLKSEIDAARHQTMVDWGTYWFNGTQEACPVDNNILAASGELDVDEDNVTVRYTAPYAQAVEYGWQRTQPIYPVRKKALSWEASRTERLSLQALRKRKGPANRVTVAKVVTPAQFQGISYVRVPLQRARRYLGAFWRQALRDQREAR